MDKSYYLYSYFVPKEFLLSFEDQFSLKNKDCKQPEIIKIRNIYLAKTRSIVNIKPNNLNVFFFEHSGYLRFYTNHFEYLPFNVTENSEILCEELDFSLKDPHLEALRSINWEQDILDYNKLLILNN